MKLKWVALCLTAMSLLTLAPSSMATDASDDDTGRDDKQVYHLYNNISLLSALKIQYDKPRIVIKSVYPQLQTEDPDESTTDETQADATTDIDTFNDRVTTLVQQAIADFKNYVTENNPLQQTLKKRRNDFYLDYASSFVRPNRTPIISIRFSTQGVVTGMAHPYHSHFVLNYDLKNATELQLSDIFKPGSDYLTVMANYANPKLARRLKDDFIPTGTNPTDENYKVWNIKANGLLITFDEGKVAPYYQGAQTVLIPYPVLAEVISPDSPLSKCTTNKRRCNADVILTGGFIDEADNSRVSDTHHGILNPILSQR